MQILLCLLFFSTAQRDTGLKRPKQRDKDSKSLGVHKNLARLLNMSYRFYSHLIFIIFTPCFLYFCSSKNIFVTETWSKFHLRALQLYIYIGLKLYNFVLWTGWSDMISVAWCIIYMWLLVVWMLKWDCVIAGLVNV